MFPRVVRGLQILSILAMVLLFACNLASSDVAAESPTAGRASPTADTLQQERTPSDSPLAPAQAEPTRSTKSDMEAAREYLQSTIEVAQPRSTTFPDGSRGEAAQVHVVVENIAARAEPLIVFTGVWLTVDDERRRGGLPDWVRSAKVGRVEAERPPYTVEQEREFEGVNGHGAFQEVSGEERGIGGGEVLFPGDVITFDVIVPASDLPYARFKVEGTLSTRHYLRVTRRLEAPAGYSRPPIVRALREFNLLRVHRPLQATLAGLPRFDGNTTLSEIEQFRKTLHAERDRIAQEFKSNLGVTYPFPNRDTRNLIELSAYYLRQVDISLEKLDQAVGNSDRAAIAKQVEELRGLGVLADKVDAETEALMATIDASDSEVDYEYRERA